MTFIVPTTSVVQLTYNKISWICVQKPHWFQVGRAGSTKMHWFWPTRTLFLVQLLFNFTLILCAWDELCSRHRSQRSQHERHHFSSDDVICPVFVFHSSRGIFLLWNDFKVDFYLCILMFSMKHLKRWWHVIWLRAVTWRHFLLSWIMIASIAVVLSDSRAVSIRHFLYSPHERSKLAAIILSVKLNYRL